MSYINIALFWVFFGFLCAYFARKKGRNPTTWFWLGIGLGLIGVIVILLLPKPKAKTKKPVVVIEPPKEELVPQAWYTLAKDKTHTGPHSIYDLQKMFKEGTINEATYFCQDGAPSWSRLQDLPDLKKHL